jgi:hypothetical protein
LTSRLEKLQAHPLYAQYKKSLLSRIKSQQKTKGVDSVHLMMQQQFICVAGALRLESLLIPAYHENDPYVTQALNKSMSMNNRNILLAQMYNKKDEMDSLDFSSKLNYLRKMHHLRDVPWPISHINSLLVETIQSITNSLNPLEKRLLRDDAVLPEYRNLIEKINAYNLVELFAYISVRCLINVVSAEATHCYPPHIVSFVNQLCLSDEDEKLFDITVNEIFLAEIALLDKLETTHAADFDEVEVINKGTLRQKSASLCSTFSIFATASVIAAAGAVAMAFLQPSENKFH